MTDTQSRFPNAYIRTINPSKITDANEPNLHPIWGK